MENKLVFEKKELSDYTNKVLGISGENEQEMLIFLFEDGFVDGICYLELEFQNGSKYSIETKKDKENECYKLEVKNSLLKKDGIIRMQLKVVQETAVWKSVLFEMYVLEAINAVESIEEDYPNFVTRIDTRMQEIEIGFKQLDEKVDNLNVPTKEEKENWNNKVDSEEGKGLSSNDFTDDDKNKLDSLDKYNDTEIKELIKSLQNALLERYLKSETFSKEEIKELINAVSTMTIEKVNSLPTSNISTTTIYLVLSEKTEENNVYDEFIYVSEKWERIASTRVDLSNYVTTEMLNQALSNIDLTDYARKEEIENFTTTEYVNNLVGNIESLLAEV